MYLNIAYRAKALECRACLGVLDDPKLLDCGHAVCQKCVVKVVAAHRTAANAHPGRDGICIKCTECGKETEISVSPDSLATDYRLLDLVAPEPFVDAYACTDCGKHTPIAKLLTCKTCQEKLSCKPLWFCAQCAMKQHREHTTSKCNKATRQQIQEACQGMSNGYWWAHKDVRGTMSHLSGAVKETELISQLLDHQNHGMTRFEERVDRADNTLTREDIATSLQDVTDLKQKFEQASAFAKDLEGALQVCRKKLEKLFLNEPGEEESVEKENTGMSCNLFGLSKFDDGQKRIRLKQCRVEAIPDLSRFTRLQSLIFRENLLTCINNNIVHATLTELDLYGNQITVIRGLDSLANLRSLNVSYNRLKKIEGLTSLVKLKRIYLEHNNIEKIEGLETLVYLELLDLGDNRIKAIENLDSQRNLRELRLGNNKINKIENISRLSKLRVLNVSGNRITKLENLDKLMNLEQLHFAEQGIETFDGVQKLNKLKLIGAGKNSIVSLEHLDHLQQLGSLWLYDNKISQWSEVDKLAKLAKLNLIFLGGNPVQTEDRDTYRRKVIKALPQVTHVDGIPRR